MERDAFLPCLVAMSAAVLSSKVRRLSPYFNSLVGVVMSFRTRVFTFVVLAAAIPLLMATFVSVNLADNLAMQQSTQLLVAMRDNKKHQLARIANNTRDNVLAVADVISDLKVDIQSDTTHSLLSKLNKELQFYDIFIISPSGDVVYTAAREADYQTNLISGPYSQSGLASLFKRALAALVLQPSSKLLLRLPLMKA